MKQRFNLIIGLALLILAIFLLIVLMSKNTIIISPKEFVSELNSNNITTIYENGAYYEFSVKDRLYRTKASLVRSFIDPSVTVIPQGSMFTYLLYGVLVICIVALIFILKRIDFKELFTRLREVSPSPSALDNKAPSPMANPPSPLPASNITLDMIAGIDEVKAELIELVDYVKAPAKYRAFDIYLPRGALLVGPPGVGKTMLAKALSSYAGLPFYYESGSSFAEVYVGLGARRVRELFNAARANAPAIIFIDEIDALGKARGAGRNDEREATLNELLTQMDGFKESEDIIVLGASNNIEVIDRALLRAGRFDRRIHIGLPDLEDRKRVLHLYLDKKPNDIDVDKLASECAGYSSAMLKTLINEGMLYTLKKERKSLTQGDIDAVKDKVYTGLKAAPTLDTDEKEMVAHYKAARAFVANALGLEAMAISLLQEDRELEVSPFIGRETLIDYIKVYLAGSEYLSAIKNHLVPLDEYILGTKDRRYAKDLAKNIGRKYHLLPLEKDEFERLRIEVRDILKDSDKIIALSRALLASEHLGASEVADILS